MRVDLVKHVAAPPSPARITADVVRAALGDAGVVWVWQCLEFTEAETERRDGIRPPGTPAVNWTREVLAEAYVVSAAGVDQAHLEFGTSSSTRWITAAAAATMHGTSVRNITARAKRGSLPARRRGRRWEVDEAALRHELTATPTDTGESPAAGPPVPSGANLRRTGVYLGLALSPDGIAYVAGALAYAERCSGIPVTNPSHRFAKAAIAAAVESAPVLASVLNGTPEYRRNADLAASGAMKWISTTEAAELLDCTARNVRSQAASGALSARRGPNGWQIDSQSVQNRLTDQEEPHAS